MLSPDEFLKQVDALFDQEVRDLEVTALERVRNWYGENDPLYLYIKARVEGDVNPS
jgi:hypothetical protein